MRKQSEALSSSKIGKLAAGKSAADQGADNEATKKKASKDAIGVKRDFFGRIIKEPTPPAETSQEGTVQDETAKAGRKAWVTYHDGFSNAVRKPISMGELMAGF